MRKPIVHLIISCGFFCALLVSSSRPVQADSVPASDPIIVVESSEDYLELALDLTAPVVNSVELLDGNVYQTISIPGAGSPPVGKPQVPVIIRRILIPNGMEASLEFDPGDASIIDNFHLNPVQEPPTNLEDAPLLYFVKDEEVYAANLYYPRDYLPDGFVELGPVEVMRGQQMAEVRIYPYHFNPDKNWLEIYPDLTVRVNFEGDIEPIPGRLQSKIFDDLYRQDAINAEDILEAEESSQTPELPDLGPYGWDYLIFTDQKFEPAADKLAAWKDKMGYKTLVTVLPKGMTAQQIKDSIYAAYTTWDIPPEVVLLIGDAEFIPPFYKTWHDWNTSIYKGKENTQGYVGTDIYYSTLESAPTGLGTIIDPDGDLQPEVLLGRLLVDADYEAMDLVNAIINYEKSPPTDASYYDTVVMAAQFQDGGEVEVYDPNKGEYWSQPLTADNIEDRRFTQDTEDIAIFLEGSPTGKKVNRLYFADPGSDPQKWNDNSQETIQSWTNINGMNTKIGDLLPAYLRSGFNWNADAGRLTNAINAGAFLVTHRDHGGRTRWSQPRFESISNVGLLTNKGLLPVVWSLNCSSGWFDNETDFKGKAGLKDLSPANTESFTEMWFRNFNSAFSNDDYGAVGVVSATRVTYGTYSTRLFMGMVEALWPKYTNPSSTKKPVYQMGAVLNHGKAYMSQHTDSGDQEKIQLEAYHYFGDPTMETRTQKPPPMVVYHDNNIPLFHPKDFSVLVKWKDPLTGNEMAPLEDAKVTVKKSEDDSSSADGSYGAQGISSISNTIVPRDHWVAYTGDDGVAVFPGLAAGYPGEYEVNVSAPNHLPVFSGFQSIPGGAGGVKLDAEIYSCGSSVVVSVADKDLENAGSVYVTLVTESGDAESLQLNEVSGGSGLFTAAIQTGIGRITVGDNFLSVSDGIEVSAIYLDADAGGSGPQSVEDTAIFDCQPPEFEGLKNIAMDGCRARLEWEAASDPNGPIMYQVFRDSRRGGSYYGEKVAETWLLSASDLICGSGEKYYYNVRAIDGAGNMELNTVEMSARFIGQLMPFIPFINDAE